MLLLIRELYMWIQGQKLVNRSDMKYAFKSVSVSSLFLRTTTRTPQPWFRICRRAFVRHRQSSSALEVTECISAEVESHHKIFGIFYDVYSIKTMLMTMQNRSTVQATLVRTSASILRNLRAMKDVST